MTNFLANQIGSDSLVSGVQQAIGKISATEAEKKERPLEIAKARAASALIDVACAREHQGLMEDPGQAGWLVNNIHPLLAFCIMGLTFMLYTLVIVGGSKEGFLKPETKDIVIYILGALTTVATQVVSYYFGSSSGSADKSKTINAISKHG